MMQIIRFLFNKRLYPVWIAGQIWLNLANGNVIAIQDGNHNWGGNTDHQVSYSLNPAEFSEPGFRDPKQPDPNATIESRLLISIKPAVKEAGDIDYESIHRAGPYLIYLLKRPPPPVYLTV